MTDPFLDEIDRLKNELAKTVADEIIMMIRRSGLEMSERAQNTLHRDLVTRVEIDLI